MGWSLTHLRDRNPELLNATLLACGKSLHLANAFESKCKYVLRIGRLAGMIEEDPTLTLDEMIMALPADKMLAATIQGLLGTSLGETEVQSFQALEKAKNARNFIAHEGASFGMSYALDETVARKHLTKLREAVTDLAAGDNIVSVWVYEIEEKMAPPFGIFDAYPRWVDDWVFGKLRDILDWE